MPPNWNSILGSPSVAVLFIFKLVPFACAQLNVNPVSATCVKVISLSSPKDITASSAKYRSENCKEDVPNAAPSCASGTNAVVAVIVVPWIVLFEVTEPAIVTAPLDKVNKSTSSVWPIVVPSIFILSTVKVVSVPTLVSDELVTPLPRVVLFKTGTLFICKFLPL